MTLLEKHAEFCRRFLALDNAPSPDAPAAREQRSSIAQEAKNHFKQEAAGKDRMGSEAVYFQFWSTVARRAKFLAK